MHLSRVLAFLLLFSATALPVRAKEWKTGSEFGRQLKERSGVLWEGNPLRQGLQNLANSHGVAIWLDRRVDPGRKVAFSAQGMTLENLLASLAAKAGLESTRLEDVIYIGPPATARALPTLLALQENAVAKWTLGPQTNWRRRTAWKWEELTPPRDLLKEIALAARVRVTDHELLPHDLWPAGDFPPLSPTVQLSLLLAGFDLSFEISPDAIRLQPIAYDAAVELAYSTGSSSHAKQRVQQLAEIYPAAGLKAQGENLVVSATFAQHHDIARLLRGESITRPVGSTPPSGTNATTVYTLTIENQPVGGILQALGRRLEKEVVFDPAISGKLRTLVSLKVEKATLEELLAAATKGTGLTCTVEEKRLLVTEE